MNRYDRDVSPGRPRSIAALVVAVRDLDAAVESYRKLGFGVRSRSPREQWGVESVELLVDNLVFELIAPTDDTKPVGAKVQKFLDERGEGLYMASFRVDDIRAEYEQLSAEGVKVGEPTVVPPDAGVDAELLWPSPRATHGAFLELVEFGERLPEALQT